MLTYGVVPNPISKTGDEMKLSIFYVLLLFLLVGLYTVFNFPPGALFLIFVVISIIAIVIADFVITKKQKEIKEWLNSQIGQ
jgi:hypothetical protein